MEGLGGLALKTVSLVVSGGLVPVGFLLSSSLGLLVFGPASASAFRLGLLGGRRLGFGGFHNSV